LGEKSTEIEIGSGCLFKVADLIIMQHKFG